MSSGHQDRFPGSTVFTVDESVERLAPELMAGGSPLRLFRFRAGARDLPLVTSARGVRGEDLAPDTAERLTAAGALHPDPESLPAVDPADATVVIPVRDRPDHLDRVLRDVAGRFSCIVVDDASREPALVRRVAERHGATYLHLETNAGPGGARNAGLGLVDTPFVVFLDSDMRADPQGLSLALRHFADGRVAAVAPRVLTDIPETEQLGFVAAMERIEPAHDMGAKPAIVALRSRVPYVPTACLVCRTNALGQGFDASLRTGEDVDLVWRLAGEGWIVRYEPAVSVRHTSRPTVATWAAQHFGYGLSASRLAKKHGDDIAPARLPSWAATFGVAALIGALAGVRPNPRSRTWRRVLLASGGLAAGAWAVGTAQTRATVRAIGPELEDFAGSLTRRTAASALQQGMALWLRHWSPAILLGLILSVRVRRLTGALVVVDALLQEGPLRQLPIRAIGRTLTRTFYGFGVWAGALRTGEWRPLVPILTPSRNSAAAMKGPRSSNSAPPADRGREG